ncbi:PfkB family carbohydrate kinase [Azospirillum sp. TSO22-1]|uniref:PfkB family carbohydrate kinase n=1 Tax=Azospirillum sp. TSO22-1 TaxID=716789 RepID=UPI000D6152E3|nr:PfkB family carbohydrate kinase [Azospirillum sp. TSO22-1]PWC55338.1 ADP-heptose synthase [Azospirillum sp. TSO22-1]
MTSSLTAQYGHKIKTAQELREILGPLPRARKAILCHGVFDIVHPGHVRHLLFAKSKADILIASLTADRHIDKGKYRPHVPQDLRALNLAAFEMVDYVVIDENDKPLTNLGIIRPDYFAKGYEYNASGQMHPKTREELEVVEGYGGQIIFTPGDIVYSSSNLINLAPPQLWLEKLLTLMDRAGIGFDDLRRTLDRMAGKRVHVVGDTIVDSYTHCAMIGGQTKTPTMSVLFENQSHYIGGAGIVAKHMKAAGAEVVFSTVLGEDPLKAFVLDGLAEAGVEVRAVIDPTRPTVNKNAIVAGGYRLLKIDTLDNRSISDSILDDLARSVRERPTDAVVFSDFRHGLFNRRTIPTLVDAIPDGVLKVADSQVASRWGNITEFKGFDLITPNEREARFALADQDSGVRPLASLLYDTAQCKLLILKLGARGVLACRTADHEALDSFFVVDSFADTVVDPVGAGDALLAYSTLAMLAGGNAVVATILGSMAAACECEFDGNIPVTPQHLMAKIDRVEREARFEENPA